MDNALFTPPYMTLCHVHTTVFLSAYWISIAFYVRSNALKSNNSANDVSIPGKRLIYAAINDVVPEFIQPFVSVC